MKKPSRTISSLVDLAQLAGVSASTVSRALAGNPVVSAARRAQIAELAQEHGFQLNQTARNLRLRRSQAIGVVMPLGHETGQHVSDPFFITLLGYLADALTERGYDMLLSRIIPTNEWWLDRFVDSGRVDGVILIGQSNQLATIDRVAARYLPLVVWGAKLAEQAHCTVGSNNWQGGLLAARHLLSQGRRRLLFLGNIKLPEPRLRYEGFAAALKGADIDGYDALSVPLTAEGTYPVICDYLSANPAPDGVFAASDIIAMSAIRALVERGARVPEGVSVVGYDDVSIAAHTSPPLSTVAQDIERGAGLIVDLLFKRMSGITTESVVMDPQLIVRGSSLSRA